MGFLEQLSNESIARFNEHGVLTEEELIDYIRTIEDRTIIIEHFLIEEDLLLEIEQLPDYRKSAQGRDLTRFGFEFDDEDNDLSFGKGVDHTEKKKLTLPSQIDHSHKFPPPGNQGKAGTCVAWAIAYMLEFLLGFSLDISRLFIYYFSKQNDNIKSEGTLLSSAMEGISERGICEDKYWPYTDTDILRSPSFEAIQKAKNIKLIRYEESSGYDIVEWIKGCLSGELYNKNLVVAVGLGIVKRVWNSEIAWKYGKIMEPLSGESAGSGHALGFVGYKNNANSPGGGYFTKINSWGTEWASDTKYAPTGFGIISYQYVRKYFGEAYVAISAKDYTPESEMSEDQLPTVKEQRAHMVYTGSTGAGKTYELKKDIERSPDKQFFITDVQGDISDDKEFVDKTKSIVWDVVKFGLPYNILDNRFKESSWDSDTNRSEYAQFLLSLIKSVVTGLGGRQSNMLLEMITDLLFAHESYDNIDYQLSDVMTMLETAACGTGEQARIAESLKDRLNPFFKTGVFDCLKETALTEMLTSNKSVIFKCKFSNRDQDRLKLLSIFIITYMFRLFKVENPRMNKVIVQDEFHLMANAPIFDEIVREGRKYGAELWAVSQNIEDVLHILPNVGSRKVFTSNSGAEIRKMASALTYTKGDKNRVLKQIKNLKPFEYFDPLSI